MLIKNYMESGHLNTSVLGCFFDKSVLLFTIILLLTLVFMLISAWKAPKWVRPAGCIALSLTLLKTFFTIRTGIDVRIVAGDEWNSVMGLRVWYDCTTVAILGLSVYLISIIIRIVQTPRI